MNNRQREKINVHKIINSDFAENKDFAKIIRVRHILPDLELGDEVEIDFSDISGATQSFIHALLAEPIRNFRQRAFDGIYFSGANENIQQLIRVVYRYMQESLDSESVDK